MNPAETKTQQPESPEEHTHRLRRNLANIAIAAAGSAVGAGLIELGSDVIGHPLLPALGAAIFISGTVGGAVGMRLRSGESDETEDKTPS